MYIEFDKLPEGSRIWIYQASRPMTEQEQLITGQHARDFIDNWQSHGHRLEASFNILDNYFVVIGVDDSHLPSGCSIDASVGFMRQLGEKLGLDFFGRTNIPFWENNQVKILPLNEVKSQLKSGTMSEEAVVINTLAQNKAGLSKWTIPLKDSWLNRYLPQIQDN